MKNLLYIFLPLFVISFFSCSSDNDDDSTSEIWILTEWTIGMPLDINNDGISSSNLLDEIDCFNGETLQISSQTFSSLIDHNPTVEVYAEDATEQTFKSSVECSEGAIGFASEYYKNGNTIEVLGTIYNIVGDKMSKVVEDEVTVYNSDFTQVIATLDSTKTYERIDN